jgi:RNA 2',3'-cyclic 3'-phosphodiesterase
MRPSKRLFVGVRISVATANTLAGCAETLARRARDAGIELRWVPPVSYHVTLAFLGWTGVDAIGPVCDALELATAGIDRISFRTARLGAFASFDQATTLWAGIDDPGPLTRLAAAVGEATGALGFARDARPYHPHVTIARLREARAIREVVLPMAEQMFGDTKIDAVTLLESEVKTSGSVYHEIEKMGLRRARSQPQDAEKRQRVALERGTPEHKPDAHPPQAETDDGWPRGQGPTD